MSVLVSLAFRFKPEHTEELKNFFEDETRHTRGFDGCNGITVHSDQDDSNHWLVLGDWDSRQDHEKYLSWRAESGDVDKFMGWLDGELALHYFDRVEV